MLDYRSTPMQENRPVDVLNSWWAVPGEHMPRQSRPRNWDWDRDRDRDWSGSRFARSS